MQESPLSYTIDGAVRATGLARSRLYDAIRDGSLRTFLAGRRRMVTSKALEQFVAKLEREGGEGGTKVAA